MHVCDGLTDESFDFVTCPLTATWKFEIEIDDDRVALGLVACGLLLLGLLLFLREDIKQRHSYYRFVEHIRREGPLSCVHCTSPMPRVTKRPRDFCGPLQPLRTSLNRVVLPAPFGPISEVIVPSATSKLAPSKAAKPPKCLWRFWTTSITIGTLSSNGESLWLVRHYVRQSPRYPYGDTTTPVSPHARLMDHCSINVHRETRRLQKALSTSSRPVDVVGAEARSTTGDHQEPCCLFRSWRPPLRNTPAG